MSAQRKSISSIYLKNKNSTTQAPNDVTHVGTDDQLIYDDLESKKSYYDDTHMGEESEESFCSVQDSIPHTATSPRQTINGHDTSYEKADANDSFTSFDNFKCDSGIQSNLDVSDVGDRTYSNCESFCTEVQLQLSNYKMAQQPNPDQLKPQTVNHCVDSDNEMSDYDSKNSDSEMCSTECGDSESEINFKAQQRHSSHGEIVLEREDECQKIDVVISSTLKKEIICKNFEIKELKVKLKVQKEKNKELEQKIDKGEKTIASVQAASKAEIRKLRQDLQNLRKERESLRKELANNAIEEKQQKALARRRSLQEGTVKKIQYESEKRNKVYEAQSVISLKQDLKRKEKELDDRQKTIYKLECEKCYLGEEIYRITGVEEGFWSDEKLPRPPLTVKEKCLVRKNSNLNLKLSRLEVSCKNLSKENVCLKNKVEMEIEKPMTRTEVEKNRYFELQKLKKKNLELSTMTRKLEEKVKTLEKKSKVTPSAKPKVTPVKKEQEKETTYQKQIQQRDLEIERMKIRMRELVKKLTGKNGEITRAQSTQELSHIMKVVTKERLQLERHLAMAKEGLLRVSSEKNNQENELGSLKDTNSTLRQQLDDLELLTRQHNTLEKHVKEKDLECVTLKEKLKLKNEICHDLESQLAKVIEKNTELTIQNSDLQKQIQELQHVTVSEECRSLKQTLGRNLEGWTSRPDPSVQQCSAPLDSRLRLDNAYSMEGNRSRNEASMEHVLTQMKDASEKKKELEKQHAEALYQLRKKQAALEGALQSQLNKKECADAIEALKSKIRELEKKAEVQNLRHEELILEMQSMKRGQSSPKNSWSRSGSLSAELQTPESGDITPGFSSITSTVSSSFMPSNIGLAAELKQIQSGAATDLDNIVAKIRQDNKILAAMDKSRTSIGLTTLTNPTSKIGSTTAPFGSNIGTNTSSIFSNIYSTPLNSSTVTTMAALDLSQPFTSPLVNSFSNPVEGLLDPNLSHLNLVTSLGNLSSYPSSLPGTLFSNTLTGTSPNDGIGALGLGVPGYNILGTSPSGLLGDGTGASSLPTIITTSFDKDDPNILNGNIPGVIMAPNTQTDNRVLDVLEIPGKGRCHVYIARYSYDPFRQSPNENPEAELMLNAGDYVLVWGSMDEVSPRTIDGFFDGEVLDGRRGLVPSNFVEKLVGNDLIEFHQSIVMGLRECDESVSTSVPQDLDFITQDESQLLMDLGLNPPDSCSYSSYLDIEDMVDDMEDSNAEQVPPPVQLTLERQLNKSILIGWNAPEAPPGTIDEYHVYVNGLLKTTVKASERTRALVEGVDSNKLHRISVRSVTPNRRTSRDAACTMIIGHDPPVCPSHVRASNITSTSAVISWLPANSNFQHTVCVNSVEVRTVKPGVYRHTITGLSFNTLYRVTVKAKNLRAPQFNEKLSMMLERTLSASIEFRTLPKGLPEPPVDVQVEMGPQDGSLLVTWLPVTIDSSGGTSNGAPVTGYAVYADGKKITEVDSPTGDHALIDLSQIHGFEPKQITVRTKSRESVSADSVPTSIPTHFHKGRTRQKDMSDSSKADTARQAQQQTQSATRGIKEKLFGRRTPAPPVPKTDHLGQPVMEHEENYSDKEMYPGPHQPQHHQLPHPHQPHPHQPHPHQPHPHQPHPHQPHHQLPQHPQQQHQIPSIGRGSGARGRQVTKDYPGMDHHIDDVYRDDDYDRRRGRFDSRGPGPQRGAHTARRGVGPQRERDPQDRFYRDQQYDQRDTDPYRGPPPRRPRDPRDMNAREYRDIDPRDIRDPRDRDARDYRDDRYDRDRDRDYRGRDHPRIFVALFDYDPPTMSPNPEACEEELGFREGQLIKVYGEKDADGFYWGEAGGRSGYVPGNMVSEVQVDDDRVAQELLKESEMGRRRRDQSLRRAGDGDRWGDIYANMPVRKMIAMYDYDPQELSPNVDSEVELSFQTGDIIYVYGDMDDDGFYMGELRSGQRGLVPSNFLQDAPSDYDDHRSRRDTLDPRDRGHYTDRGHVSSGQGAHGPPPPPRPDQRDRRKDTRTVASRSLANSQEPRGQMDNPAGHKAEAALPRSGRRSISMDRNRSLSMDRKQSTRRTYEEDDDPGPAISSADLDQLMVDFDLDDPIAQPISTKPPPSSSAPPPTTTTTETKLGGIAGSLGAGLSSGLSSLSKGKLGEMATQNPVTDVVSKGKDFLFKRFGL